MLLALCPQLWQHLLHHTQIQDQRHGQGLLWGLLLYTLKSLWPQEQRDPKYKIEIWSQLYNEQGNVLQSLGLFFFFFFPLLAHLKWLTLTLSYCRSIRGPNRAMSAHRQWKPNWFMRTKYQKLKTISAFTSQMDFLFALWLFTRQQQWLYCVKESILWK